MDEFVPQVLVQKFDRHLEEMAQKERIAQARQLAPFFPATNLRGAGMPEEGCELLPGNTPLRARDPESIGDGQRW